MWSFDREQHDVFSAHAEVVPVDGLCFGVIPGILRARGGSSRAGPHISRGE